MSLRKIFRHVDQRPRRLRPGIYPHTLDRVRVFEIAEFRIAAGRRLPAVYVHIYAF